MGNGRWWLAAIVALPTPAAWAAPGPAAPTYPIAVRVALSSEVLRAELWHAGGGTFFSPPNPACTVPVGLQARDAYAAAGRRMFRAGAPERAVLSVAIASAAIDGDADGWHAVVEHDVVLRAATGQDLGRWTVRGRERISGLGEEAIPVAFARAAEGAAHRFEAEFEDPPAVATWLAEGGYVRSAARAPPPPEPQPPSLVGPAGPSRGRWVAFADGGFGVLPFTTTGFVESQDRSAEGWAVRAGVSGPWMLAQVMGARWEASVAGPTDPFGGGGGDLVRAVDVTAIGVEAGPLLRLGDHFEAVLGIGAHWLTVERTQPATILQDGLVSTSFSRVVPGISAAVRYLTGPVVAGVRLRVALEARRYFDTDFPEANVFTSNAFSLLFGLELPVVTR